MESSFQEIAVESDLYEVDSLVKKWKKSDSKIVAGSDCSSSPGFDCNICLDFVQDPVVTLCGHLFCWPCIYKWLSLRNNSIEHSSDQPELQCPVCKSLISESTLVPLYGRGKTLKTSEEKSSNLYLVIPPRPPAPVSWHLIPSALSQHPAQPPFQHNYHFNQSPQELHHHNLLHQPQSYYEHSNHHAPPPSSGFSGHNYNMPTNNVHPVVGMFGGMVYERMFGNSMPNSYNFQNTNNPYASHISPRQRRQVTQADKSLTRICFFLFCCIILCLLLF